MMHQLVDVWDRMQLFSILNFLLSMFFLPFWSFLSSTFINVNTFRFPRHLLPLTIDFFLFKPNTNTTTSCPYVTAVGATKVYPGHSVYESQPESAANDLAGAPYRSAYSSGGGFSNVYNTPDYQKDAVST
jgi:hypothetical protein